MDFLGVSFILMFDLFIFVFVGVIFVFLLMVIGNFILFCFGIDMISFLNYNFVN